jgi:alkaline phosphatase D
MATISRRGFLRTAVVSAGAASLGPSLLGCGGGRPVGEVFPQSVASGDPRPDSIVLWTRAVPEDATRELPVTLEVGTDAELSSRLELDVAELVARPAHDHCLRVKVTGLSPGTTYHYRFVAEGTASRVGRFRTAPAADADAPIRFALLSCQDWSGRYYNTLLRLLDETHDDLDFVLHVGDYVYETTADPGFMMTSEGRALRFRAPEEAIELGSGEDTFHAARSVGNYRDLYRAYRTDPILQRVHEKFPFVCIWDDHEFSDDCWQDVGTFTDGVLDEQDTERRVNSEQVWLEYMPVALDDEEGGVLERSRDALFPNTQPWRAFRFGRHVTLAVTDYRSNRPDHPTPEDAFPGAVVLDEAQIRATLAQLEADGELPDGVDADAAFEAGGFRPCVDLSDPAFADHRRALELLLAAGYAAEGVPTERAEALAARYAAATQKVDAAVLQETLDAGRDALPAELASVADVDPEDPGLERGLPYLLLGKSGLTGQLGARYLTVQRTYELVQAWRTRVNGDAAHDDVLGAAQQDWLAATLGASDTTWNLVAGSVCNTSLVLDLEPFRGGLPPGLPPERLYLNVDHWDGFPERRRALMRDVYRPANAVLLAGDIHAAYATDFGADAAGDRVIELTTSSVSSGTFRELLERTGSSVASIRDSGLLEPVLGALDNFLRDANEQLQLAHSDMNGVAVIGVDGSELRADFHLLPEELVAERFYHRPEALADRWRVASWTVRKEGGKNGPLTPA